MHDTYFASAARMPREQLQQDIEFITRHPVIKGLMTTASGLFAVLNEHRQVLAMNDAFLKLLGIHDPESKLGLRPGEVVSCMHASEMPGGCGTSRPCASCGAAISIVVSLATGEPVERKCALTTYANGSETDLSLRVRACRVSLGDKPFVVIFLQDITTYERLAMLEKAFFHDIVNLVSGLAGNCKLLTLDHVGAPAHELADEIYQLSKRLADEVKLQSILLHEGILEYHVSPKDVPVRQIICELRDLFANHPVAEGKRLQVPQVDPTLHIHTDATLVLRVLANMASNAFESTGSGGEIRIGVDSEDHACCFRVWNEQAIPDAVAPRIFQRHFSTKADTGRGIGTYSMKLFGEQFLKGKVSFTTSERDGTEFRLSLPGAPFMREADEDAFSRD